MIQNLPIGKDLRQLLNCSCNLSYENERITINHRQSQIDVYYYYKMLFKINILVPSNNCPLLFYLYISGVFIQEGHLNTKTTHILINRHKYIAHEKVKITCPFYATNSSQSPTKSKIVTLLYLPIHLHTYIQVMLFPKYFYRFRIKLYMLSIWDFVVYSSRSTLTARLAGKSPGGV